MERGRPKLFQGEGGKVRGDGSETLENARLDVGSEYKLREFGRWPTGDGTKPMKRLLEAQAGRPISPIDRALSDKMRALPFADENVASGQTIFLKVVLI